ncbi:hypothetical protein [Cutibacterium avidum]|uniref:hypothetical protein n=1 Tax=Cutibacterium avidum TaxID=33010 RepID=UPI00080F8537|nr:hypothetical protein [Cutibacterium avidum]OCK13497.1 hypothetical protein A9G02_11475 [Cutibacterium avidum]
MTATAPEMGQNWTGHAEPMTNLEGTGRSLPGIHPDVLEMAEFLGATKPNAIYALQRRYDRAMAAQISREEFTAVLTKVVGRKGSTPVDRMGDGAARRIDRERTRA